MVKHFDRYVPDEGPHDARILFVGEAPGEYEHEQGRPFVGPSGELLINVLERAGSSRAEVRLANLCHHRPHNNEFENLIGTEAFKKGVSELYAWISIHKPTVIAPLGAWPLLLLTGKRGIKRWRGSILSYIHDESLKVIATIHPAAVLRDRGLYPTFDLDIKRIVADSKFSEKRLPTREYVPNPRGMELEEWVQRLCRADTLACDIETVKNSTRILCVGFAPDPNVGVCIVPEHDEGDRAISKILESSARKIFQFGCFDTTQLRIAGYNLCDPTAQKLERPYYWDTFIAQHVLAPELPRSLEYLTSIYTREPYYKHSGKDEIPSDVKSWSLKQNRDELYIYNSKDCCTTFEVAGHQMREIDEDETYSSRLQFEMSMLEVASHISDAGMFVDESKRALLERVHFSKWAKKQFVLDRLTGYKTNVYSPKLIGILYDKDKLGLPSRRNRGGRLTADEDAIVSLIAYCKGEMNKRVTAQSKLDWQCKLAVCQTVLEIRGLRKMLSSYLLTKRGDDGRIRSTYNVGGTETGRWSAMKYVDGTGLNAQTFPRDPIDIDDDEWAKYTSSLTTAPEDVTLLRQLKTDLDEEEDAA